MKTKPVSCLILSNIQSMMTGVWRIEHAHDLVTLDYTDGKREGANIAQDVWAKIHDKPFMIVSEVQSKREPIIFPKS